jgi:hypothetical protein
VDASAPERSPDSWIVATAHAFPSLVLPDSGSRGVPRDLGGAPHSQWRDRAGFGDATTARLTGFPRSGTMTNARLPDHLPQAAPGTDGQATRTSGRPLVGFTSTATGH